MSFTFRYTLQGVLGTLSKQIVARNEEEARAIFNGWVQDQCFIGIMITPK